jgi:hypothetical protein
LPPPIRKDGYRRILHFGGIYAICANRSARRAIHPAAVWV